MQRLLRAFVRAFPLVVLAACSSGATPGEPSLSASSSPTPSSEIPPNFVECANDEEGYSIWYPDDWSTASTNSANACRWFDRDALTIDEGSEPPPLDLEVVPETGSFDEVVGSIAGPGSGEEMLSSRETEVNGHPAIAFETRSTGEGPYPVDSRTYGIVVDVNGRVFRVLTQLIQPDTPPYEENQVVVRQVAETIRVH